MSAESLEAYYSILKLAKELQVPVLADGQAERIAVRWVQEGGLGVGLDRDGVYQLLIVHDLPLTSSYPRVRTHLRFLEKEWLDDTRAPPASIGRVNQVILSSHRSAIEVLALLAEKMLRSGFPRTTAAADAFCGIEFLLNQFLQPSRIGDEAVKGLWGELYLLERVFNWLKPEHHSRIAQCWDGAERVARDFTFTAASGTITVEVKTTESGTSRHHINNLDQVSERPTEQLYILSVGVAENASGRSLPDLVDSVLAGAGLEDEDREGLKASVARYGTDPDGQGSPRLKGYDYDNPEDREHFDTRYDPVFARMYRLSEYDGDGIKVLRTGDVEAQFKHMSPVGVSFTAELPARTGTDLADWLDGASDWLAGTHAPDTDDPARS